MDKNTIWAIVLCGVVVFAALFVESTFILPKQQARAAEQAAIEAEYEEQRALEQSESASLISTVSSEFSESESTESVIEETEEFFTVKTNKAEVKFTNRGGDVVSYKLLEHLDHDTGMGVEMVDNVTSANRAFSIALGDYYASPVDDIFKVKVFDDKTIGFYRDYYITDAEGQQQKIILSKLYTFMDDEYTFKLDIGVESEKGLNFDGVAYTLRTSPQIGPHYDKKANRYEVRDYISLSGSKKTRKNFSDKSYTKYYDWAGVAGKYFAIIVKPADTAKMDSTVRCSTKSENDYQNAQVFVTRDEFSSKSVSDTYYIYVGPRSERDLIRYNSADKNGWELVNSKFNQALRTSGILSIIEVAIKWCLEMIYKLVRNYGVSIILLTLILKIVLFPLNKKSAEGSIKMQELQPKMQALQDKYGNDQQKLSEETQKLYKEAGYNPASGCLPMILQMIILFAMYNVFNNYFDFRGVTFIPGWIDDLTAGDSVYSWEKEIPVISSFTQNNIRILPFVYLASQLLNGMITQYGGASAGQNKGQMWFMMYGMPILFFFILTMFLVD